jgi:hypothetical protein
VHIFRLRATLKSGAAHGLRCRLAHSGLIFTGTDLPGLNLDFHVAARSPEHTDAQVRNRHTGG